ncbi:MAG: ATP-binding cassette domain-containing protein [Spirochaetes bacterium]|nr:ATP-binding cassette domain-containing protein [Spirochaetota bacterium]
MHETNYSIELQDITVTKNKHLILDDISFKVPMGITTIIVGLLGSGKSTLLKVINSIIVPDSGKVLVNEKPYTSMSATAIKTYRRSSGFVFQDSALWANKTVFQNLELPLLYHFPDMDKEDVIYKVKRTLNMLGFEGDINKRPSDISAGNRKLISFARALITDPDILMIDSPETSIDFATHKRIISIIKDLKLRGKTLIICTYDEHITSMLADHVVVLFNKKIYASGSYREIVTSNDPVVKQIMSHVLDKVSNFDGDILNLINPDLS